MKLLLFIVFFAISSIAYAQDPKVQIIPEPFLKGQGWSKEKADSLIKLYMGNRGNFNVPRNKLKPGIHYLADGMPCIVPEEPTAGNMPNAWTGSRNVFTRNKNAIPNPAMPKNDELKAGKNKSKKK